MSRKCAISNKTPMFGKKRSHAMNTTNRRWNVNLQKAQVEIDGKMQTVRASARAMRTLKHKGLIKK